MYLHSSDYSSISECIVPLRTICDDSFHIHAQHLHARTPGPMETTTTVALFRHWYKYIVVCTKSKFLCPYSFFWCKTIGPFFLPYTADQSIAQSYKYSASSESSNSHQPVSCGTQKKHREKYFSKSRFKKRRVQLPIKHSLLFVYLPPAKPTNHRLASILRMARLDLRVNFDRVCPLLGRTPKRLHPLPHPIPSIIRLCSPGKYPSQMLHVSSLEYPRQSS